METTLTLSAELAATTAKIRAAEAAGRSASTLNRLYRKLFQLEDALKAVGGGW